MASRSIALALSLVTAAAAFAACDSDEDNPPPTNESTTDGGRRDGTTSEASTNEGGGGDTGTDSSSDSATTDTGTDAGEDADTDAGTDAGPLPTILNLSSLGHDRFHNVTYDAQGNIYVVGVKADDTDAAAVFKPIVAKFTPAGALDTNFGSNGVATVNVDTFGSGGTTMRGIVVQSTGNIVIAGGVQHTGPLSDGGAADSRDRDVVLIRLTPSGGLDNNFDGDGIRILDLSDGVPSGQAFSADNQWGLALAQGDKLVISAGARRDGGTDTDYVLARLGPNGALDTSFNGTGVASLDISNLNASPRNVLVLPDDSVLLAGYFTDQSSVIRPVLWKLSPTGGDAGMPVYSEDVLANQTETYAAALQDASFVTTGYGRDNGSTPVDILSLRVNQDGGRDHSYGDGGFVRIDVAGQTDQSRAVAVLPDGRIVLAGATRTNSSNADATVIVLLPNGAPDTSFGPSGRRTYELGGTGDFFWGVAVSPDGKSMALAGIAAAPDGGNDNGALLVLPTGL